MGDGAVEEDSFPEEDKSWDPTVVIDMSDWAIALLDRGGEVGNNNPEGTARVAVVIVVLVVVADARAAASVQDDASPNSSSCPSSTSCSWLSAARKSVS